MAFRSQPSTDGRQKQQSRCSSGAGNNLLDAASKTGLFAKSGVAGMPLTFPAAGIMTLSYRLITLLRLRLRQEQTEKPAPKPERLVESDQNWRVIYQDPRTSTRGWVCCCGCKKSMAMTPRRPAETGEENCHRHQRLERSLRPFLKGESDLVLSYTTSPAYHISKRKKITTPL